MKESIYIFLFFIFSIPQLFSQGAIDGYMKAHKETDFAFTYSYEKYNIYYFGTEKQDISLTTQTMSLFIAHGLNKRMNLIVSIPYIWTGPQTKNFQDAIVSIKYLSKRNQYEHGKLSRITAFGFSFPISGYESDTWNPIGQRATTFNVRHLWQYESKLGYFLHLQSGLDFRVIPSTQAALPVVFRVGVATSKFYFDTWFEIFHTFNSGVDQQISGGEGSRFLKIGGTFYYPITKSFGAFVGGAHFLKGANIGKASRVNVGIVYKLKR